MLPRTDFYLNSFLVSFSLVTIFQSIFVFNYAAYIIFFQACHYFWPAADNSNTQYKLRKFGLVDDVVSQMVIPCILNIYLNLFKHVHYLRS